MAKREYIQANKDWLEAKAKEEGVKALPKGIYYKVLSEGRSSSARLLPEGRKNGQWSAPALLACKARMVNCESSLSPAFTCSTHHSCHCWMSGPIASPLWTFISRPVAPI